jgi:hypothetical protein
LRETRSAASPCCSSSAPVDCGNNQRLLLKTAFDADGKSLSLVNALFGSAVNSFYEKAG